MSTIIDKLLNRDSESKSSYEELQQIAQVAEDKSEQLAALIDQARRELENEEGIKESLRSVEARVSSADGSLTAFAERVAAAH